MNNDNALFSSEWKECRHCRGEGCFACMGSGGYEVARLRKPKTEAEPQGNLTCDICGYCHDKPDHYGIVVVCADGILRCKVCRGVARRHTP